MDQIASVLLSYQPYANALVTITRSTVKYYAKSVEYLFSKGFKYIIASLNYPDDWNDDDILILKREYQKISDMYEKKAIRGDKFYFSPFEVKLATHIKGKDTQCIRCALAQRQISIAPDGTFYPCVQFVGNGHNHREFSIGNLESGIDEFRRGLLFEESKQVFTACAQCALQHRCNYNCSCLNWQTTGKISAISPVLCETERLLIPIVDRLGERLYNNKVPAFLAKHYNESYPFLSLMEDASCLV